MTLKIIGFIHLCGMIIENMYGFVFIKNIIFDKLYIISFISIPFSWVIFKNECIISYISKKIENPHYTLGNDPSNVKDILNRIHNLQPSTIKAGVSDTQEESSSSNNDRIISETTLSEGNPRKRNKTRKQKKSALSVL